MRLVALAGALYLFAFSIRSPIVAASPTRSPIEHIVVLMQEGHSFDNYFGSYPGANGLPPDICMPVSPSSPTDTSCIRSFRLGNRPVSHLDQSAATFRTQYNDGRMDNFVYAQRKRGLNGALAMGYYDGQDLPFYWNVADEYVLFDHFFGAPSGGLAGRMSLIGGEADTSSSQVPTNGFGNLPTVFDALDKRGISWKYYVQNYDPQLTYRTMGQSDRGAAQVARVPLLAFDRFLDDPQRFSKIVDLDQYYEDTRNGTLPAVAYIATMSASERAPSSLQAGPRLVRGLVNILQQSDSWERSAFLITYDGWGGWYDHVPPPDDGYGFRVPTLLISPYARRGYVDKTVLEHASILRFIRETFDLPAIGTRDTQANSLQSAFDWNQTPRVASIIAAERRAPQQAEPPRYIIYICYSAIMIIASTTLGWAIASARAYAAAQHQTQ
jgi:phospholipase C